MIDGAIGAGLHRTETDRHDCREVKVSAIVPAYRSDRFIAGTLDSLRAQTLQGIEIIVVDDASPDRTASIVAALQLKDSRISLISKASNGGVSRARNDGIAAAQGRWLAFVDADDALDPSRLATLVEAGERLAADWIADDQLIVDESATAALGTVLHGEASGAALVDLVHLIERDPPERIGYGTLKPLVRRSFLRNAAIGFRPGIERFEDFVFHVEVGLHGGRMALVNRPLYFYRRHPDSATARDPILTLVGMLEQNQVALRSASGRGAQPAIAALRRREALIRAALDYRSLVACLRRADIRDALRVLRERPGAGRHLLDGLTRAARRRLQSAYPAWRGAGNAEPRCAPSQPLSELAALSRPRG